MEVMKNQFIRPVLSFTMFLTVMLLFTSCEDLSSTESPNQMKVGLVEDLGAGKAASMCACLQTQYPAEELSQAEREALLFMREEEKLARDVYQALFERWNVQVFSNIAKSEQRHKEAILCLLQKYNLTDPVGANGPGVFQNTDLQALYTVLVQQGSASKEAAFRTGAQIEDLDIRDLMSATPDINNADILAVFGELTKGSRNHLRAFTRQLVQLGATYTPQYISAETYAQIIASEHERGGSACVSNCNGNQQGNGCNNNNNNNRRGRQGGNGNCDHNGSGNGGNGCNGGNGNGGNGGNGNGGNGTGGNGNGGNGNGNGGNGTGGNGNGGNGNGGN
jgi:hypothetical protein